MSIAVAPPRAPDGADWVSVPSIEESAIPTPELDSPIAAMRSLRDGWNGPGTSAPSPATIESAAAFLGALADILPQGMAPTDDGEVAFEWDFRDRYSIYAHALGGEIHVVELRGDQDSERTMAPVEAGQHVRRLVKDHAPR